MKRFWKILIYVFISIIAAWFLTEGLLVVFSHLRPVYLQIKVKSETEQSLLVFTSTNGRFSSVPDQTAPLLPEDTYQTILLPIPPHRASHLRLGFGNYYGIVNFSDIRLNGYPLDLAEAFFYQMRNVRYCDQLETAEVSCRIAGERAYVTFPPEQLAPAVSSRSLQKWRWAGFLLCLIGCLLFCKKFGETISIFLHKKYPVILFPLLGLLLIYTYYAMCWYAFSARLTAMFIVPSWKQFFLLAQEQAWTPALLLFAMWAAFTWKNKYIKITVLSAGTVLLLTEILDCVLLYLLNARFSPEQIRVFGPDTLFTVGPFLKSYLSGPAGMYTLLLPVVWLILCIYVFRTISLSAYVRKTVIVLALSGFIWYLLPSSLMPAERTQLLDWPRLSLQSIWPNTKKEDATTAEFHLTYSCQQGLNSRKNVIIILVESLSSYMSAYFSGGNAENWTPRLDHLARQYTPFTNYRATGPDTTQSLFGILTGIPVINYYAESNLYREPKFYTRTLTKTFRKAGYHTVFMSSASLVYSKDDILNNTVFDEISKDNDPFYDGKKRFVFHSVSDDVLYARAEKWLEDYNRSNPYLIVLETTTTHNPFIDPQSGQESVEKAVRYADKALGNFIANFEKKYGLDNTLLVITSDHRIMQPLTETQTKIFGPHAEAAIPFIIIGSPLKGNQPIQASHLDLAPSLEYLTLSKACFHTYQHNLFSSENTRNSCTLFQSFIDRYKVLAQCQDRYASVYLESNFNQVISKEISPQEQNALLSFINWIRDDNRY